MNKPYYIYAALIAIIVILLVALNGKKDPAQTAPSEQAPVAQQAPSKSVQAPVPAPAASYPIHVKKGGLSVYYSAPTTTVSSEIRVENPPLNTMAVSPLMVSGNARGTWFFEGSMPVIITDAKGRIIGSSYLKAQSDWMTEDFVPFLGKLIFPRQPTGSTGVVVISNDNPSGLASKAKHVEILVTFN